VTIAGVRDSVADGNQNFTVVVAPLVSADSRFSGIKPQDIGPILNLDIPTWPTAYSVSPDFVAVSTGRSTSTQRSVVVGAVAASLITLSGGNFFDGVQVRVGLNTTATNVQRLGTDLLTFVPPASAVMGYQDVTVINADGGYSTLSAALYYTADCARPGYYGPAGACIACPAGAYCPGIPSSPLCCE